MATTKENKATHTKATENTNANPEVSEQKQTPVTVAIENFKTSLAKLVNESGLPIYLLDGLVKDVYSQIHSLYIEQYNKDMQDYES